jgi:DNA gyrase subunit B
MIFEILDNSIDEAIAGFCNKIKITLNKNNSITIKDNGRGIPIEKYKNKNIYTPEIIMTVLHSGGKFNNEIYKYSGGLHGVGASVVNALSEELNLKIYKNNIKYSQKFHKGKAKKPKLKKTKKNYTGTKITFLPCKKIFSNTKFDFKTIKKRIIETSYLNPKIKITIHNKKTNRKKSFKSKNGLIDFIKKINKNKKLHNNIINIKKKKKII